MDEATENQRAEKLQTEPCSRLDIEYAKYIDNQLKMLRPSANGRVGTVIREAISDYNHYNSRSASICEGANFIERLIEAEKSNPYVFQ